jgi:hypothetical protein
MKPAITNAVPQSLPQALQASQRAYRRAADILNDKSAEIALMQAELEVDLVEERIKEIHSQIDDLERKTRS